MAINPNLPETQAAGWYDQDANPITLHGPFPAGQGEAKTDAQTSGASSPICFRWEDQATVASMLGH